MHSFIPLTAVTDLKDVLPVIRDLNDWMELGLQLGLLYSTLERIESEQRGDIKKCRMKMVVAWLKQEDDVSQSGFPSWNVLKAALNNIGENELASKII